MCLHWIYLDNFFHLHLHWLIVYLIVSSCTWNVANGLDGVGGSVDDGHHGRDDPEEDPAAHLL